MEVRSRQLDGVDCGGAVRRQTWRWGLGKFRGKRGRCGLPCVKARIFTQGGLWRERIGKGIDRNCYQELVLSASLQSDKQDQNSRCVYCFIGFKGTIGCEEKDVKEVGGRRGLSP